MKKNTSKKVLLVITGILIIIAIIGRALKIPSKPESSILYLISLVFTALYGFWFYKKPHGNMLKYAMLIFAVTTVVKGCHSMAVDGAIDNAIIRILASLALIYCAGRLNRIDQNKVIMPIICLVFLGISIYKVVCDISNQSLELSGTVRHFSYTINCFALIISYFVRYDEHKEAGLMDAPKK